MTRRGDVGEAASARGAGGKAVNTIDASLDSGSCGFDRHDILSCI